MGIRAAVTEIDKEIARLKGIRDSLISTEGGRTLKEGAQPKKVGGLSAATKKKIADSQRKRWALKQKAAPKR